MTAPLQIAIQLGADLSDEQLLRLEKVASACPVRRSIEAGIEFIESTVTRHSGLPTAVRSSS